MKKILLSAYQCDPTHGSESANGYNWAAGLRREGYRVTCITRMYTSDEGKKKIEENHGDDKDFRIVYVQTPLRLQNTKLTYLKYIVWQWAAYRKAKQLHFKEKFDLVHHVVWGNFYLGSFMYKLKIPFIFGPVGGGQVAPVAFKRYFGKKWYMEIVRDVIAKTLIKFNPAAYNTIKYANNLIASNLETKEKILKYGGSKCALEFDVKLPQSFFPIELSEKGSSKELKLLWVGRLLPRKGVLLVIEAMAQLKEYSDITLTIVGDGEMRKYLEDDIKKYNLKNVKLIGRIPYEKVSEEYSNHDVFFFTSLRDSNGMQVLEAMAFGLPVVTLQLHGQDLLVNEAVGIKASVNNPEQTVIELANAILLLHNDRKLLGRMSKAAFNFAKVHTWEKQVKLFVEKYY